MSDTRIVFRDRLLSLMEKDESIILLTGDLGYSILEPIQEKFPDRYINCGCAEQNMVGVAAGLARVGKKPYVYSGAKFLATRALEQMRDDVCYQNLDVHFIGTGASGFLGFTHNMQGTETIDDLIKNLPNLQFEQL